MNKISYSQCGQDLFVIEKTNYIKNGSYVDLGCWHPTRINNTYLLESKYEWFGLSVDIDSQFSNEWKERKNTWYINKNALEIDYKNIFSSYFKNNKIDYLSLDLEPANITLECLLKLPLDDYIFSVITYEHDYYRFGEKYRNKSREYLKLKNYVLLVADVGENNCPFEDWYVHESLIK